jgi:hypothetical protein
MVYRIIIAGSRGFNDYNLLKEKCDYLIQSISAEIVIVSGNANGADKLGERYAKEKNYKVETYPAQWEDFSTPCRIKYNKHGKPYNALAGHKRNQLMADCSDMLIAFWDGKSTGTQDMLDRAYENKLVVRTIEYNMTS